ncbi:MAG: signal peptidase I [Candidatus Eremiobacteraeota bacterium]|nr:signal peptidase I [Candidatus Eremiobacteraeota bacterium]
MLLAALLRALPFRRRSLRFCGDLALVTGLLALFLTPFTIRIFVVPSISMEPTLRVGDVILVDRLQTLVGLAPSNGSIVVFRPPRKVASNDFVKRVVARSGDTFSLVDGIAERNGRAIPEPYLANPPAYDLAVSGFALDLNGEPLPGNVASIPPRSRWASGDRVPNGYAIVLGDNRNYSDDSHLWGFLKLRGHIVGQAIAVVWPLSHIALFSLE